MCGQRGATQPAAARQSPRVAQLMTTPPGAPVSNFFPNYPMGDMLDDRYGGGGGGEDILHIV